MFTNLFDFPEKPWLNDDLERDAQKKVDTKEEAQTRRREYE